MLSFWGNLYETMVEYLCLFNDVEWFFIGSTIIVMTVLVVRFLYRECMKDPKFRREQEQVERNQELLH